MSRPPLFLSLLFIALLIPGLLTGCHRHLNDPEQATTFFFGMISQGHAQQAYGIASFAFQTGQTYETFEATAKDMGLMAKVVACNWTRKDIGTDAATLEGDVIDADGGKIPFTIKLVIERGAWRVFSLKVRREDSESHFSMVGKGMGFSNAVNHPMPSEAVLHQLVEDSIVMFNDAIQQRSFADFYNHVSFAWQQQLTQHQLQTAFQPFIDAQVNVGNIRSLSPVYDTPPQVNSEGLLILNGHYPANPYEVDFSLRFTYEMPNWKLFGIDVQMKH